MSETTTEPAVEPDNEPPVDPDAAEPDPADDGTDLEGSEPEPAEAERDDTPSSQALLAALEREEKRHKKAIASALNVDLDALHDCPTCQAVGYTPEPIEAPPPLVQDPYTETCPRCLGNGSTLSGATARALEVIPCNGCSGSGYVQKPEQPGIGGTAANGVAASHTYSLTAIASPTEAAEVAALRARGYTILEPIEVPAPAPA